MIGRHDFGLILDREECLTIYTGMNKIFALAGKSKDAPKDYYKFLQKLGLIKFIDELKSAYEENDEN